MSGTDAAERLAEDRKARAWVTFDAKYRRCEEHNRARYYCGCYFAALRGEAGR